MITCKNHWPSRPSFKGCLVLLIILCPGMKNNGKGNGMALLLGTDEEVDVFRDKDEME